MEIAVTTATVYEDRASLEQVLAKNLARNLLDGASTRLTWTSDDDPDTASLRDTARQAFEMALHDHGLAVPTTVAELAHTLAELGVFERSEVEGAHGLAVTRRPP